MDKQALIRSARQSVGGADFMTKDTFQKWMGVSRNTASRKLNGLDKIGGKYFFIPDVVQRLMEEQ